MVQQSPAGRADRVGGGPQVAGHEGQVTGRDRDVGAGSHRQAEVNAQHRAPIPLVRPPTESDRRLPTRGASAAEPHPADSRGRSPAEQLAGDPVAPARILLRQAQDQPTQLRDICGRPGRFASSNGAVPDPDANPAACPGGRTAHATDPEATSDPVRQGSPNCPRAAAAERPDAATPPADGVGPGFPRSSTPNPGQQR
jgi:hypothetical protein